MRQWALATTGRRGRWIPYQVIGGEMTPPPVGFADISFQKEA
jgi:hypothetical protein